MLSLENRRLRDGKMGCLVEDTSGAPPPNLQTNLKQGRRFQLNIHILLTHIYTTLEGGWLSLIGGFQTEVR